MKNILLVLFLFSFAFSQTRTSSWALPQWGTGDTLRAGAKNTTPLSNYSLNNAFARIDAIGSVQMDSSGLFRSLYGRGTGNLTIDAGSEGATPVRIVLNDSLYGTTNWQTTANLLVGGNATIGGYITVDSIQTTGDIWIPNGLTVGGDVRGLGYGAFAYTVGDSLLVSGTPSVYDGKINMYSGLSNRYIQLRVPPIITAPTEKILYIPNATTESYLATQTDNDSLQAPTVHAVLFASEKIAGVALNDTSALFTEWSTTSGSNVPIVRMKYLHKAGITYVTARYYAYTGGGGDGWETQMAIGSLTQADSDVNGSYGSTVQVNQLNVSGLTAGTLYDLQFKVSINTSGTSYFKELIITAESN